MTEDTIVAVYDTAEHAQAAIAALGAAGVPESAISVHANGGAPAAGQPHEQGFWSSLFGGEPDHDTAVYDRSVQGGSSVVTVRVPEEHIAQVMQILEAHHPIDIDERAGQYGLASAGAQMGAASGTMAGAASSVRGAIAGTTTDTTGEPGTIQLSEEQLAIGKRVVNRGGTRIRRFVVETPVEQQVTLHDEQVTLERRPVTDGRPATDSFSEKVIEMTATGEEVVVSKTARVVEEVGLRRQGVEHVETVRDTVRKEDVAIEQIPGGTTSVSGGTATSVPGSVASVPPAKPRV